MPQSAKNATLKWPAAPSARKAHKSKARRSRKARQADPTQGLEVAHPQAAGIDVGCAEHWVSVPPGCTEEPATQRFGCCTAEWNRRADGLKDCGVDTVVMEATGNYGVVLYDILEARPLKPGVVNPRYAKNMSGKKGDIPDCQWRQKLHPCGLFANSFRPTQEIRGLRTYWRQREMPVVAASQQIQHLQKSLTEMNVPLTHGISDLSGESGLRIIDAILAGERKAKALAKLKGSRMVASLTTLARALEGHWKPAELFCLEQARLRYAHFQEQIQQCQQSIPQQMKAIEERIPQEGPQAQWPQSPADHDQVQSFDLGEERKRVLGVDLTQIDGMGPVAAQVIISEVGTDLSWWPTDKPFSSWLGLCPDHRISGGKILGRSTRPVVSRARNALRWCAYSLTPSKSWLGAKYRRLKHKLGAPQAMVAMAHHWARLIYRLIKHGEDSGDKGAAVYEAKYRAQRITWLQKQAREMNRELIELQPVA